MPINRIKYLSGSDQERERRRSWRVRAVTNNIVYIAPEGYMAIVG